jgi:hypothetical protein
MKVQKVGQPLTCPECNQPGKKHLFKVKGQSNFKCPECLGFTAMTQGPQKTLEIDAVNSSASDSDGDERSGSLDASGNG